MVLEEKLPFSSFFSSSIFFLNLSNPTFLGLCVKGKSKTFFLSFILFSFLFLFLFSFVALNCASSSDGCVGSAVGGQRSCVNGVKWRPV